MMKKTKIKRRFCSIDISQKSMAIFLLLRLPTNVSTQDKFVQLCFKINNIPSSIIRKLFPGSMFFLIAKY